ncbi:AAA family ATPase [Armatimonas sp.]|uniref:AAA family ATPase n=1 Tax=Armatimonas sp. TaxID=1872638 RepID=UPI0037529B5F
MITRIHARNYRNLVLEESLMLSSLNVFVGANGSGKSNLIRILRFLQDAITGAPDERRGVTRFENAMARFGSGRILDVSLERPAFVELSVSFTDAEQVLFHHGVRLEVKDENTVLVRGEELSYDVNREGEDIVTWLYHSIDKEPNTAQLYLWSLNDGDHTVYPVRDLPTNELYFHSLPEEYSNLLPHQKDSLPLENTRREVIKSLGTWAFYDSGRMSIEAIRRATPDLGNTDIRLESSGENLLIVLHNLIRENIEFEERLNEAFSELFPRTRKVRILPVGRRTVQLEWYPQGSKNALYQDDLSDGTLRMLCWAAVLLSPTLASLIVLDEPEAGIHPAWLRVLAGWIREASRKTQVIISTHSSDLLDYFTEDIESVHVFQESREQPGKTEIASLHPVLLSSKLNEGWKLGDLYRVGDPGVGGWPW